MFVEGKVAPKVVSKVAGVPRAAVNLATAREGPHEGPVARRVARVGL